jgi:hypothetical protein
MSQAVKVINWHNVIFLTDYAFSISFVRTSSLAIELLPFGGCVAILHTLRPVRCKPNAFRKTIRKVINVVN